jgi:outer membrane lipoprotein-sorting protein
MRKVLLAMAAMALPLHVSAQPASGVELSATAVQSLPQGKTMTGRLFLSKGKMRQEMTQEGQTRITITDPQQNIAWMLNPERQEYVEMKGPPQGAEGTSAKAERAPLPDEPGHPCQQKDSGLTCTKLGTEAVNGRPADKWEFVASQGQETYKTVMWIDQRMRMPLRAEFPGGMVSELKDVKEGPQPADLFQVPADYKKIELPRSQPGTGQPGATGGGMR